MAPLAAIELHQDSPPIWGHAMERAGWNVSWHEQRAWSGRGLRRRGRNFCFFSSQKKILSFLFRNQYSRRDFPVSFGQAFQPRHTIRPREADMDDALTP
jgi:hypothetical protein